MADSSVPTFNHVAMSVAPDLLAPASRGEILDFYGEVFGWTAMPGMSKEGELLVEDFKVLELHSFYVGFRLPMRVEVQCYQWAEGVGPQSLPPG
jgi:hypothetical protein